MRLSRNRRGQRRSRGSRLSISLHAKVSQTGRFPRFAEIRLQRPWDRAPDNLADRRSPSNPAQRAARQCLAIATKSPRTARRCRRLPCVVEAHIDLSARFAKSPSTNSPSPFYEFAKTLLRLFASFCFNRRRSAPRAGHARRARTGFRRPAGRSRALSGSRRRRRNAPNISRPLRIGARTAPP